MNRIACSFAIAALTLAPAVRAWADDAPTKEQLEAAKQAFVEGKQLHDAGKVPEAIEKFKESYRLSKNPLLLYNIALTLDENKQTDSALFYYRKFLADAPADAAQRPPAEDRVKVLENQKLADEMASKPDSGAATERRAARQDQARQARTTSTCRFPAPDRRRSAAEQAARYLGDDSRERERQRDPVLSRRR